MKGIMNIGSKAVIVGMMFLLGGCCTCRKAVTTNTQHDSVRVEYRERVTYVPDTVYLEIPKQTAERTTTDSVSHLENEFAISDARITAEGLLYHDLRTKPQEKAFEINKKVVTQDSLVYRDRQITVTKTVSVPRKLSKFEKAQMFGFWVLAAIVIIFAVHKMRKVKR